jgi:hypothetical protein
LSLPNGLPASILPAISPLGLRSHAEVRMSTSKKSTKKARRAAPKTVSTDRYFQECVRLAPAVIKYHGVLRFDDDSYGVMAAMEENHLEIGTDENIAWDLLQELETWDRLSADEIKKRSAPDAMYEFWDALQSHVAQAHHTRQKQGYLFGLAVGLELAKGQIGGAR